MAKPLGLFRRKPSPVWYYRVRVPSDLVASFGKPELKVSLKTRDYAEAKRARDRIAAEIGDLFAQARARSQQQAMPMAEGNVQPEVDWLSFARRYVEVANQKREESFLKTDWSSDPQGRLDALENTYEAIALFSDPSHYITQEQIATTGKEIFDHQNLSADLIRSSDVSEAIRRALLEVEQRALARLEGNYGIVPDPLFAVHPASASSDKTASQELGLLAKEYVAEYPKRSTAKSKRLDRIASDMELVVEFFGPKTRLQSIDRKRCREFRDFLDTYPANGRKKFSGQALTLDQIVIKARAADLPVLSWTTQDLYLKTLKDFIEWARAEGFDWGLNINDLKPSGRKPHARDARHPFSSDQLKKIFNAPHYLADYGARRLSSEIARDTRFWVPLLALFTGMRLNEICQLETADVGQFEKGAWSISVNADAPDKSVKTAHSRRKIPLHPQLIRAGFAEFVTFRKRQGSLKLFPELKLADGYYSKEVSKWFNRTLLRQVLARAQKTSFHSFRHNFQDALRAIEAPEEIKNALGGRSEGRGSGPNYGDGYFLGQLRRYIERVVYPGLDLSHIRWRPDAEPTRVRDARRSDS